METTKKEENNEDLGFKLSNHGCEGVLRKFWVSIVDFELGLCCEEKWLRVRVVNWGVKVVTREMIKEGNDKVITERLRLEGWGKKEMEGCIWRELNVWRKTKETVLK